MSVNGEQLDKIKDDVEKNGNVKTLTMERLRNAYGVARSGVNVRADISRSLAGMGLGHVPEELPVNQHEQVRVYKHGTPVGDLITMVLKTGEQNDARLSERVGTQDVDYPSIISKIRELVAE